MLDRQEVPLDADRLFPALGAGLVLGLVIAVLLLARRRQLPPDFVGQVKADAYLAMFRALLALLAGLTLALGTGAAGSLPYTEALQRVAIALIVIGGVAFVARAALYVLRIKPQLDQLRMPVVPASPAARSREMPRGDE
jgi:hypothetical protein